ISRRYRQLAPFVRTHGTGRPEGTMKSASRGPGAARCTETRLLAIAALTTAAVVGLGCTGRIERAGASGGETGGAGVGPGSGTGGLATGMGGSATGSGGATVACGSVDP